MSTVDFSHLDLEPLLNPKSIGIVGVSQRNTRGTRALANLLRYGYGGSIYPINPKYDELQGMTCYPSVDAVPEPLDTLLVAVPGANVPDLLQSARQAGTRSAVILSSGFREAGEVGLRRHEKLEELALGGMPICGPNCFGIANLSTGATVFSGALPDPFTPGPLAVLSQSGGFTSLIANTLIEQRGLGAKYMISCGNQAGAMLEDYLQYLVRDDDIHTIACYAEGLHSASRLQSIGEEARHAGKTIVILKAGQSASAVAAAASHTGSVAGSAEVAAAVLNKAGFIQSECLDELIETVSLVATGDSRRIGRRIVIVSGGGGETSHGSDAADRTGVELPELEPTTISTLKEILPDFANPRNPLDLTGSMYEDSTLFPNAINTVLKDNSVDLVAVNLGLREPKNPAQSKSAFVDVIASLDEADRARIIAYGTLSTGAPDTVTIKRLREVGIPSSVGSDFTLRAVAKVAARNEKFEQHESAAQAGKPADSPALTWNIDRHASAIDQWQAFTNLGLPMVNTQLATSADEAAKAASSIGFPVSLKMATLAVSHKSDIGGVRLNLTSEDEVRSAYEEVSKKAAAATNTPDAHHVLVQEMAAKGVEMLLGIKVDPALGPAVVLGFGGLFVEILRNAGVAVPPVSNDEARSLVAGLKGSAMLTGGRGTQPADVDSLAELICTAGRIAEALPPDVSAIDLNPVIVHPQGGGVSCVDLWIEWAK